MKINIFSSSKKTGLPHIVKKGKLRTIRIFDYHNEFFATRANESYDRNCGSMSPG